MNLLYHKFPSLNFQTLNRHNYDNYLTVYDNHRLLKLTNTNWQITNTIKC